MVFKRYIKKHGKKLGPYYYENVRGSDGRVKSIYVGTNPHHHPRHKIRKPLFFLIIVLVLILVLGGSLFLFQNKSYVLKKVNPEEPNFEVDQILLKVLVRQNEFIEKQLRVTNIGNGLSSLSVEVQGLSDLVTVDSKIFTIKPGQTKILLLNFSSFIAAENIEQQPGVYVGKIVIASEKFSREIPIVIEIETRNILFDMNLNPVAIDRKVKQGSDTTIEVRLFNLESIESQNVDVGYFVKDMNGNTIVTESETVVVKTQASFFKTISIPKSLKPGPYVFAAQSKFGNSVGTSSYLFEVVGPEEASFVQFCKNSILCLGLSLSTILLIVALIAYFYFFIGAYIYEKVTGIEILASRKEKPKERRAKELEEAEPSFFDRLKTRLQKWKPTKIKDFLRREREIKVGKKAAREKISFASSIKDKISKWQQEREIRKLEKGLESAVKGQEIKGLRKEEQGRELGKFYSVLGGAYKTLESKDIPKLDKLYIKARNLYDILSNEEQQQAYGKLMELYNKRNELAKRLEQIEENKRRMQAKEEEKKAREAERRKLAKERKEKIKNLFHKIGLYRTPEEKKQIALQKEKDKQERLNLRREQEEIRKQQALQKKSEEETRKRRELELKKKEEEKRKKLEEELRKQKELERQQADKELKHQREIEEKRKQEEIRRKQIEEEEARQEELKRKEEIRKQKEEEQRKLEEEKRLKQEEEIRRREEERQNKEKLRAQKLEAIRQLEEKLKKNEEELNQLNNQAKNIENEIKEHPKKLMQLDNNIKNLDSQTSQKSQQYEELSRQKDSASEEYKRKIAELEEKENKQKNARDAKLKELKQKLADRQSSLMQEMEQELGKLSPAKRKATEKWKRLEIKAKLKLEEQNIKDEIAEYDIRLKREMPKLEETGKSALNEISKSQRQLKKEIEDLNGQKEQMLREKESVSSEIEGKNKKLQDTKSRIQGLSNERNETKSNLRKAKSELSIGFGFFNILPLHKEKKEPERYKEKEPKASKEDMLKVVEGKIKAREEQKRKEAEEKARIKEERRKKKYLERQRKLGKKAEKLEKESVKEELVVKEKPEEIRKKTAGKSRNFEKCLKSLQDAKEAIGNNELASAKKLYMEARNLYIGLEYHEKKEAYNELMELYNELLK